VVVEVVVVVEGSGRYSEPLLEQSSIYEHATREDVSTRGAPVESAGQDRGNRSR
jgi:hypothetical protein